MVAEVEVTFQPEGKRSRIKAGETIFEAAGLAGADLTSVCGGKGTCGKCKVIVEERNGDLRRLAKAEKTFLSFTEMSRGYRLACRTIVRHPLTVRIPEESRTGRQKLQVEGIEVPVCPEPLVSKYFVNLPKPTLQDAKPDVERLLDELRSQYGLTNLRIEHDLLSRLPLTLRDEWKVTAAIWNGDVIVGVEPGDTSDRIFGYALDIGTTKLAGYLLDLNSGDVLAAESLMNPQIQYGEDVIARIEYAGKGVKEQRKLQAVIVKCINRMLKVLLEKAGVKREEVYEVVAVGNTAMHHLFLGICPKFLALSPYTPVIRRSMNVGAREIGVSINPNGNIHVLPVVAGFVGADAVADMLATEVYKRRELCLGLDIGTNTEVFLGNERGILTCSCASGPALEGAHIKHGMRAATGAIEKVAIDPMTLKLQYWTVDRAKPCGICGSGMVDILAEMLKAGIISVTGLFNRNVSTPRLRAGKDGLEFIVASKEETAIKNDIVITQKDISEIQLAKAAIHTGAVALMQKKGVSEADIDLVFIAGAFGSYIDPENARTIGMYPEIPLQKVRFVGNSAGTGARMALVSKAARRTAEEILDKVTYVELATEPDFQAEFLNSNALPHADLSIFPETSGLLKRLGKYPKKPPAFLGKRP